MSRTNKLASHLERTVTGPMWHGPALFDVLEGVNAERARRRSVPGAHTIWELVLHITAWADIARQRLHGQATGDPTPEQDWPAVPGADPPAGSGPSPDRGSDPGEDAEAVWRRAVERLGDSHRQLAADTRQLDDDRLRALVPGLDYSVSALLHGIIEHGTYHGGQIALLKKA